MRRLNDGIFARKAWWLIASLALCIGIGTPSHAQAIQTVLPTPIDIKKVALGGALWDPQWDQIIENALLPEMLSSQVPPGACIDSARGFTRYLYDLSRVTVGSVIGKVRDFDQLLKSLRSMINM